MMGHVASLLAGVFFGMMLAIAIIHTKAGISECESNLPRSQHCILIAAPKTNDQ